MIRSLTRAWAPVPLKGQSSRITPRFASTSRAASFTGIGSVLVSITIAPRPADRESSAAVWERASGGGGEVMMMSTRRATSRGPREVARRVDIIITSPPPPDALSQTAAELSRSAGRGAIVIETSTLPIPVKEAARDVLAKRGVILLDCPLSGTGAQARVKDLIIYVSGDRAAYRKIVPVLQGFTRANYYVGAFGAGSKMKFVANLLVAIHNVAAAEAMVLGMKAGLDPALVLKGGSDGGGGSG